MSLRKIYYALTPELRFLTRKIYFFPKDILNTILKRRRKYEPKKGDIYVGSGDFIKQGEHQVLLLKDYINLKEDDKVLDIGSGIGRTAIPLTKYLSEKASYEGFDVVKKGVNWCNSKIKKDYANFTFTYVVLGNDLYNNSKKSAYQFKFPYKDASFDKTFLFSVFTHMQINEIENYLSEINRVLKSGGLCLATFFVYDDREGEVNFRNEFNFPIKRDGYRLMNKKVKSANIAISKTKLDQMILDSGLKTTNFIKGSWNDLSSKNDKNDFQDILVLKKAK